jgi:nicotinamidase-related amidase
VTGAVIQLAPVLRCATSPTLVIVDAQRDYVEQLGMRGGAQAMTSLEHCRAALAHARRMGFDVAFTRWRRSSHFFEGRELGPTWLDEFVPRATEMIFERDRPSCYASSHFEDAMTLAGGQFVIAGFGCDIGCLATAIDAHHRGHGFLYLSDASTSLGVEPSQSGVHAAVSEILGRYDLVMRTDEWIAVTSRLLERRRASA